FTTILFVFLFSRLCSPIPLSLNLGLSASLPHIYVFPNKLGQLLLRENRPRLPPNLPGKY
ncbi:hypothetical protein M407DRAFT_246982, partial [Tulasnella calospora MUT 4182]